MIFTLLRRALLGPPVAIGAAGLPGTETKASAPVNIDATLEMIVGPHGCPGLAAVALRGDRIIAEGVAGVRKKGASERITLGDQFHLGSCSKAMTATLAAILIEEGKLNWTTTLAELFGGTVEDLHPAWRNVTLQQVLAHRAGLRRDPGRRLRTRLVASTLTLPRQRREIVATVLSHPPKNRPGTKTAYSNVGYILVGSALEKITGLDWQDLMRERLFRPLGIMTGGFGAPGTAGKMDQPWGHFPFIGKPVDPGSRSAELSPFYGPAGLAHMTITDWAKFIALHLRGDVANPHRQTTLLKPDTFAKLHPAGPDERYCSGWAFGIRAWAKGVQPGGTGRILQHAGSNARWTSFVWIAPEIDFAVLTACNRGIDLTAWKVCEKAAGALIHAFASKPQVGIT